MLLTILFCYNISFLPSFHFFFFFKKIDSLVKFNKIIRKTVAFNVNDVKEIRYITYKGNNQLI